MPLHLQRNPRLKIERDSIMGDEEDRLSALPDEILHHIFSFLDMGSIARTAFLAKRWRYLFLQTPILCFSLNDWMSYGGVPTSNLDLYTAKFNKLVHLIDKVFLEDSRNVAIKKFDLDIGNYGGPFSCRRVISWLDAALIRNANHIHLKFPVSEPLQLPHHIFTNVEVFTLSSSWFHDDARIWMPSTLCTAPRIKRLHLYQVLLPDGDMNGELVLTCPSLEHLHLTRCDVSNLKVFTLSTPRLETLRLNGVSTHDETFCMVKASTPKLKWLNIRDDEESDKNCIVDYFMEDLSSLTKANIDVNIDQEDDVCRNKWSTSLIGILSKAPNLESLDLSFTSVEILTNISELLQMIPNLFYNLKSLRLDDPCKAPLHVLLKIFRGVPHLETLGWFTCSYSKHEPWAEELSSDCTFQHLKSIKIENFCGRANDFKFLELLLKKATVLENVDFTMIGEVSDEEEFAEVADKLLALPRASSTVTIRGL